MTPDNDRQKKDLEELRGKMRDPEQWAAMHEAVAERQREPGWLVVLALQREMPPPDSLKALADVMEWDVFTARQRLLAPTPRIIRRTPAEKPAEELAQWIRNHGLRAFAISEALLAAQKHQNAAAVYESRGELSFDDLAGNRFTRAVGDVACLVAGEITERTISENIQTGVFITEELSAQRENLRHRAEYIIDIHFRNTPESIRLAQDTLKYKRMFPDDSGGSAVLVRHLFQRLAKTLPGIPIYNEFRRVQDVLGTSRHLISSSQYLVHNWMRPGAATHLATQTTSIETTAEAFMIYSTLARLETLRR